jgi:hypothetical protein
MSCVLFDLSIMECHSHDTSDLPFQIWNTSEPTSEISIPSWWHGHDSMVATPGPKFFYKFWSCRAWNSRVPNNPHASKPKDWTYPGISLLRKALVHF